jgi:hypothetical protein
MPAHPISSRLAPLAAAFVSCSGAALAATPASEARIDVQGGPHAGAHTLKVADVGCELYKRPNKPRYFNVNFGLQGVKDPKVLSFVLVRVSNADGPGAPAPADFEASVIFGKMNDASSTFYMSGSNRTTGRQGGPGQVLLKDDGKQAQVKLDLQPQAGVTVKGTVTCTIL